MFKKMAKKIKSILLKLKKIDAVKNIDVIQNAIDEVADGLVKVAAVADASIEAIKEVVEEEIAEVTEQAKKSTTKVKKAASPAKKAPAKKAAAPKKKA
jgi:hypothetical protein